MLLCCWLLGCWIIGLLVGIDFFIIVLKLVLRFRVFDFVIV